MNYLAMASRALGGPKRRRMRCRRLPTTRPTPRGLQEPICPRKKWAIWTRWRLVPVIEPEHNGKLMPRMYGNAKKWDWGSEASTTADKEAFWAASESAAGKWDF